MFRQTRFSYHFPALLLAFHAAIPALATTFMDREFPASVKDAPVIVRGKVGMSYTDWSKADDGSRRIYTFYELQASEVIKGSANPGGLIMREMGGEKDGVGMQVSGAAHFERGEDVVVFLNEKSAEGVYDIRGMMMGKFNLRRDPDEGGEVLSGPGLGAGSPGELVHDDEGHGGTRPMKKWTIESLRQLVDAQKSNFASEAEAQKTSQNPEVSPAPLASFSAQTVADRAAPQLQTSQAGDPNGSEAGLSRIAWIILSGGLLAAGIVGTRVLRSRSKK